jgi:RNA polymerase sigma-70 factor (ECF subfamily)
MRRPTVRIERRRTGDGDDLLVGAARGGDERAFGRLVARHRPWVFGLIRAVVQDAEHAEDLTQEAFCRVHRGLGTYAAQGQFVPWLKQIALNLARNALRDRMAERRRQTALAAEQQAARPAPADDPAAAVVSHVIRSELRAALDALPAEQRQAVELHYFAGLSVREIAQRTGHPEGTIKTRLFHARRQVRQALSPDEPQDRSPNP